MKPGVSVIHGPGEVQGLPFSSAVRVGDLLFLSGQIGNVPGTRQVADGGITGQTRQLVEGGGIERCPRILRRGPRVVRAAARGHPEIGETQPPRWGTSMEPDLFPVGPDRWGRVVGSRVVEV